MTFQDGAAGSVTAHSGALPVLSDDQYAGAHARPGIEESKVIMPASNTPSKQRGGNRSERGALDAMAQSLFGDTALVEHVESDDAGHLRSVRVKFDLSTASALADPQRASHAAWRLQHILDPGGNDLVSCTWDLGRCTVTASAVDAPVCTGRPGGSETLTPLGRVS